jgi:hypothetical protein
MRTADAHGYGASVIEILTFRLASGVDVAAFTALDARVQTEVAYQQPGLLRRTTGRNGEGRWLILQVWASAEAAAAGRVALDESVVGAGLDALIDADSVHVERFEGID